MRRTSLVFALVAIVVVVASCSASARRTVPTPPTVGTVATPPNAKVARVVPAPAQTIEGFGASGAWWPNDLARFPASARREVAAMLFSPNGIALSAYRYNIGGGGVGVNTPARAPHEEATDAAGRAFLRAANDAHVPILIGFVNSAPPSFTTNAKSCGGNLAPGREAAYAGYLASVVKRLHDVDHVTLQYVSPMNEPDNSFGDCGQEGMQVPVAQRARVVQELGKALARQAPYAKVVADETTADAILADEAPRWLSVPGTSTFVAAIAHHTYDFPNDALRRLLPPIAKRFDKPTWMTEICCYKGSGGVASSFGAQFDPTMTQGLWLADQIYDDLTIAGDSAWHWWTALSSVLGCDPKPDPKCVTRVNPKGFNDGLLYYDAKGPASGVTQIFTTKRFYTLGQFSRYVRPGAVRHDVRGAPAGVRAMAFEAGARWTVVAWNEDKSDRTFAVELPNSAVAA
ncbi:MAG TPA: glycoside hydrolase, partial [Acidimicrobiia bacterium]|nr:glycoside hydrolase [Acidimicrobiia bacterium]